MPDKEYFQHLPYLRPSAPCIALIKSYMQDLRFSDVMPLLCEYQKLTPAALSLAAAVANQQGLGVRDLVGGVSLGRYMHFKPKDLRVGDVPLLQADYQRLLAMQH